MRSTGTVNASGSEREGSRFVKERQGVWHYGEKERVIVLCVRNVVRDEEDDCLGTTAE